MDWFWSFFEIHCWNWAWGLFYAAELFALKAMIAGDGKVSCFESIKSWWGRTYGISSGSVFSCNFL